MPRFIREPDYLVFNRRAVPRPRALDHAGKHRRAVQVVFDDAMRCGICIGQMTGDLRKQDPLGTTRKRWRGFISRLWD